MAQSNLFRVHSRYSGDDGDGFSPPRKDCCAFLTHSLIFAPSISMTFTRSPSLFGEAASPERREWCYLLAPPNFLQFNDNIAVPMVAITHSEPIFTNNHPATRNQLATREKSQTLADMSLRSQLHLSAFFRHGACNIPTATRPIVGARSGARTVGERFPHRFAHRTPRL
jgi:hypothetical protein